MSSKKYAPIHSLETLILEAAKGAICVRDRVYIFLREGTELSGVFAGIDHSSSIGFAVGVGGSERLVSWSELKCMISLDRHSDGTPVTPEEATAMQQSLAAPAEPPKEFRLDTPVI